jgi:hypothetical protein
MKINVNYQSGEGRDIIGGVDYMLAVIDDVELYAEEAITEETDEAETARYETLRGEIIRQAIEAGIDTDTLAFWWDDQIVKYQVDFQDEKTGATSAIDTVEGPLGWTAEEYVLACEKNADQDWCDMLKTGTVTLVKIEEA